MDGSSGPGYEYGRVEIFRRGFWSTICDVEPNRPDTAGPVACKMLGYSGGTALRFNNGFRFPSENDVCFSQPFISDREPACTAQACLCYKAFCSTAPYLFLDPFFFVVAMFDSQTTRWFETDGHAIPLSSTCDAFACPCYVYQITKGSPRSTPSYRF